MRQAATQEEDTNRKAKLYAAHPAKVSPFQKGRTALVKASRAIKDRLSNHSDQTPTNGTARTPHKIYQHPQLEASSIYGDDDCDNRTRLNRRIAEGQNLANPKIQALVGDGNVARKPLPVYESMRSRSQRSASLDDPFSDGCEVEPQTSPQFDAAFGIDFNKLTPEIRSINEPIAVRDRQDIHRSTSKLHLPTLNHATTYSNLTSGLTQHPNVMDFSSSPVAYSTPRVRLEPQKLSGSTAKAQTLLRSPSILDFSLEDKSDDGHSLAPSANSKSATDGSQSVKRKSDPSDLHVPPLPANKKSKVHSSSTKQGMAAATNLLATEDECAPLSAGDQTNGLRPGERMASKSRGLKLFARGKDKATETGYDREVSRAQSRPIISRRTSLPRSGSGFFGGRDTRRSLKRLTSFGADSMDIDELQVMDPTYQVGGMGRR